MSEARRLADELLARRRGGRSVPIDPYRAITVETAYAVQRQVVDAVGLAGGFKVARKPGQPAIMAPILSANVHPSPARFGPGTLNQIGIELEVGFRVLRDLPAADAPDFDARARSCVAALVALEIVDTRLEDVDAAPPLLRLADNQLNGALVAGEPREDWQDLDLTRVTAQLAFGSKTILDGEAEVPGGDAWGAFCTLARMVGSHCGGLRPGHVVITGSLNGLPFIERGTDVAGRIEGLGSIAAQFPL